MKLTGTGVLAVAALAGAALVVALLWRYRDRLNPASQNNVANVAASSAVRAVTGGAAAGGEDSVGGLLARAREWVTGTDAKIEAMKAGAPAVGKSKVKTTVGPYVGDLPLAADEPVQQEAEFLSP